MLVANNAFYGGTALRVPAAGPVTFAGNVGQGGVSGPKLGPNQWRKVGNLSRDEANETPDLIRTKINLLPPDIRQVRTIDLHELDLQADGGTHVANTQEVGVIKVVGHESKGRINKRLRIALIER